MAVRPDLLVIGPVELSALGALVGVALIACGWFVRRDLQERGLPMEAAPWLVGAAAVGGIAGARAWYAVADPGEALVSGSGLVWYGGLAGGALGALAAAWWWRIGPGTLANLGAPALALGYAIGRMGCQLAGDGDYGTASDLPWAMAYPAGTVPIDTPVHPTPLYETVAALVLFSVLWSQRRRFAAPFALAGVWAVGAGASRFLVEYIRRNEPVAAGLTAAQVVSLALVALGVIALSRTRHRWMRPPRAAAPAGT